MTGGCRSTAGTTCTCGWRWSDDERAGRRPEDRGAAARGVRGRAPGAAAVRLRQRGRQRARRRARAVRDLLGLQSDPGAGVPARVPGRRAAADLPGLPRAGPREPRRPPRGEPVAARLDPRRPRARRRRLRGGQRRRGVPPCRRSHRARHRGRRREHRARAGGHAADRRLDPARDLPRLHRLRLPGRPDPRVARHRPQGLRPGPDRRHDVHGPGGPVRHPARRGGDLHRALHVLRRRARVLGRGALLRPALLRGVRTLAHRPGPDDDAGRLPARHRVGLGRGDHGHARLGDLAAAAQGRLPEGVRRRRARRLGHRRDPVAADARRRRVHHRRVPGGELLQGAPLRDRPVAPVLPRRPARDRGRRAALPGAGDRPRHARVLAAARPLGLPLLVADRDRRAAGDGDVAVPRRALRDGASPS